MGSLIKITEVKGGRLHILKIKTLVHKRIGQDKTSNSIANKIFITKLDPQ